CKRLFQSMQTPCHFSGHGRVSGNGTGYQGYSRSADAWSRRAAHHSGASSLPGMGPMHDKGAHRVDAPAWCDWHANEACQGGDGPYRCVPSVRCLCRAVCRWPSYWMPPRQTYFISRKSSMPYTEPSRPSPDCFTPPNGATSFEIRPVLTPTMPYSSASATRKMRDTFWL